MFCKKGSDSGFERFIPLRPSLRGSGQESSVRKLKGGFSRKAHSSGIYQVVTLNLSIEAWPHPYLQTSNKRPGVEIVKEICMQAWEYLLKGSLRGRTLSLTEPCIWNSHGANDISHIQHWQYSHLIIVFGNLVEVVSRRITPSSNVSCNLDVSPYWSIGFMCMAMCWVEIST